MADLFGAKLIGICQNPEESRSFKARQLPLYIDDITMIIEVSDPTTWQSCSEPGAPAGRPGSTSPTCNLDEFRRKVLSLSNDELEDALCVDVDTFNVLLSQLVPCVGCRKSVEKLYSDIGLYGYPSIRPMSINSDDCYLTAEWKTLKDPVKLHQLMVMNNHRVRSVLDNLTKCRKNKRCVLHSLDSHMHCRSRVSWEELFSVMAKDCQEECCIIECDSLAEMLDSYLLKHRFCGECKHKITRAYELLIGHEKTPADHHYNPALFKGIKHCVDDHHLHLKACPFFLNALTERAEPELCGSIRERHAKSLDIAQVEVLTCLALFMHDRLHRLISAVKTMQQTFQILYCVAVINLHNQFEVTWENKHGLDTTLERLCAELQSSAAPAGGKRRKKKNEAQKKNRKANSTGLLTEKGGDSQAPLCLDLERSQTPRNPGSNSDLYLPLASSGRVIQGAGSTPDCTATANNGDSKDSHSNTNHCIIANENQGEESGSPSQPATNQRSRKYSRSMSPLGASTKTAACEPVGEIGSCGLDGSGGLQPAPLAAMEGTDLDLLNTDEEEDEDDVAESDPLGVFCRRTSWRSSFGKRRCSQSSHDVDDGDHNCLDCDHCATEHGEGDHHHATCGAPAFPTPLSSDAIIKPAQGCGAVGGAVKAGGRCHGCDESGYSSVELSPGNGGGPPSRHNDRKRRSSATSAEVSTGSGGLQKLRPELTPTNCGNQVTASGDAGSDGCRHLNGRTLPDIVKTNGFSCLDVELCKPYDENEEPASELCEIPLEEIEWFKRNRTQVVKERREIRERLRGQFVEMQARLVATLPRVPQEA